LEIKDNSSTVDINFIVVDIPIAYNINLGHPTLSAIKAVIAPYLLLMQFELDDGRVGKLFGDQRMPHECYYVSLKLSGRKDQAPPAESLWPSKLGKTRAPEAVMILSASTEEHGRPLPELAVNVIDVPLDNSCPAC